MEGEDGSCVVSLVAAASRSRWLYVGRLGSASAAELSTRLRLWAEGLSRTVEELLEYVGSGVVLEWLWIN